MKNFKLLSALFLLSCATKAFSAEDTTRQAEIDKARGHVFKTYTIEAESQDDICCGSYEVQMHKTRKCLYGTSALHKKWLEKCRKEDLKMCCGRSKVDTSHVICIEKIPRSSGGRSITIVTPLNPNGATYDSDTDSWRLKWHDKAFDDGASIAQNPSSDTGIRFIGGSYDKNKNALAAQMAINELCERRQGDVRTHEHGVHFSCPDAVYILHDLAQKSIDELVKDNPAQTAQEIIK